MGNLPQPAANLPDFAAKFAEPPAHTPGPWTMDEPATVGSGAPCIWIYAGDESVVASVNLDPIFVEGEDLPLEANARLIAAAPDMLAALQLVSHDVRSGSLPTNIQNAIIAAIARATGAK